jgi:hypothetical protein
MCHCCKDWAIWMLRMEQLGEATRLPWTSIDRNTLEAADGPSGVPRRTSLQLHLKMRAPLLFRTLISTISLLGQKEIQRAIPKYM